MRRLRFVGAALVLGGLLAGVGCSLINTDDLTGGSAITSSDAGKTPVKDATSDAAKGDGGPPPVICQNDGGTPGILNDTNNCGVCGHLCGSNASDTSKDPNYCVAGKCEGIQVSLAGQGRQIAQFSGYGLVWSTVSQPGMAGSGECALVVPTIYGIASSSVNSSSLFMVSSSTGAAYYASGLVSDIHGITYQDTNPSAGSNIREVGFGTMKTAGVLTAEIHGLFEPPQATVLYFFSHEADAKGPHEWTTSGAGVDKTGTIALDYSAPDETISAYQTVAMAADATWLYYGEADGVFRIRGGQLCNPVADAGASDGGGGVGVGDDGGATTSSCEGLFIPIGADADGAAVTVTGLMVDDQYIFVATSDGLLTRYQTLDGANPTVLSTQGPFYGLTQDVTLESSTVQFGTRVFASSASGPIIELDKGGTGSVVLTTSTLTPMGITVDSAGVYWVEDGTQNTEKHCANGDGRVMRVSRPPTEP